MQLYLRVHVVMVAGFTAETSFPGEKVDETDFCKGRKQRREEGK